MQTLFSSLTSFCSFYTPYLSCQFRLIQLCCESCVGILSLIKMVVFYGLLIKRELEEWRVHTKTRNWVSVPHSSLYFIRHKSNVCGKHMYSHMANCVHGFCMSVHCQLTSLSVHLSRVIQLTFLVIFCSNWNKFYNETDAVYHYSHRT